MHSAARVGYAGASASAGAIAIAAYAGHIPVFGIVGACLGSARADTSCASAVYTVGVHFAGGGGGGGSERESWSQ